MPQTQTPTDPKVTVTCAICDGTATDLYPCEGCGDEGHVILPKGHLAFLTAMRGAVNAAGGESAPLSIITEHTGQDATQATVTLEALGDALMVVYDVDADAWWITPPGRAAVGG